MKYFPGPLPPIAATGSTSLPLPLPFNPEVLWRYPINFPPITGHTSPLWDCKSQLPAALASDPRAWRREDVATFLRWAEQEFDLQTIDMDMFQMNGKAMCLLNRNDLSERAPGSGDVLFNVLQILIREANNLRLLPNSPITPTSRQSYQFSPHTSQPSTPNFNVISQTTNDFHSAAHAATLAAHLMPQNNSVILSPAPSIDSQSESPNHPDAPVNFNHSIFSTTSNGSNGSGSNHSESDEEETKNGWNAQRNDVIEKLSIASGNSPPNTPTYANISPLPLFTMNAKQQVDIASSPGLYKQEFFGNNSDTTEPNTNGRLLWDFLQQLLNDPNSRYKAYIAWKDKETGVFKIVDPAGLAKLWGIQKNHLSMNYDKMSRALRYYYRVNILKKVQGERHCYQFLRKPMELKNIKNISLLRQQISPTTKSPPQHSQIPQITIKPEPIEQQSFKDRSHELPPPPSSSSSSQQPQPSHIPPISICNGNNGSGQHHIHIEPSGGMKLIASHDIKHENDYNHDDCDKPTDLSMDGPTDLSSNSSRQVTIVCSPDPPIIPSR